ncbi:MAG: MBL fold metallo-hydrolase [SAR324 cluster bacterium]|nr:MBL fold metallo-hydrolase [SAR324 cluster bacterium]
MLMRQLFDRETCTYTYLLVDPQSHEGVLIDPVKEQFDRDIRAIEELGVELLFVMDTHVHADHTTSAGIIRQKTGAKIVFGAAAEVQAIDRSVADQDEIQFGRFSIRAIATPGHTNGCVSYYTDGMVFTGDTLLIRGCGRTDFQEGSAETLFESVNNKLFALADETRVYPGHDYNGRSWSTIAEEKQWNPRIGQEKSKEDFVRIMNNLNLDMPKKINEAVPENMACGLDYDAKRFTHQDFSMHELYEKWKKLGDRELILDNRTPEEFAEGHIPGSLNIPFGKEGENVETLKQYERVYIYCRSGRRAQTAFTNLSIEGLEHLVCISHTGMPDWINAGFPVEK